MTDAELADEIEPEITAKNVDPLLQRISLALSERQWQQIIASLRRLAQAQARVAELEKALQTLHDSHAMNAWAHNVCQQILKSRA